MSTHGSSTRTRTRSGPAGETKASARAETRIYTLHEIPPATRYTTDTASAAELARRALNEVTTSARYSDWERKIVASEQRRYLRGDDSPPKERPARANETLAAENKRLAEDALRHYVWLYHGPGMAGVGHGQTAEVGARYRQLREALNDSVRRLSEHNASRRLAAALRTYGKTPGMRDLLKGRPVAFRSTQEGSRQVHFHVMRPVGGLTAQGLRVQAYELGHSHPYDDRTFTLEQLARGIAGMHNFTLDRTLPANWSPPSSSRGAIGRLATDYANQQSNLDQSGRAPLAEQLLAYTGGRANRTSTRAKRSA